MLADAKVGPQLRDICIDCQRLRVAGYRLGEAVLPIEQITEFGVGLDQRRLLTQRCPIALLGLDERFLFL